MPYQKRPLCCGGPNDLNKVMGHNWFVLNFRHPLEHVREACLAAAAVVGMKVGPDTPRYLLLCPEQLDEPEARELYRTAIESFADGVAREWPVFAAQLRLWRNTWRENPGGRVLVPAGMEIATPAPTGSADGASAEEPAVPAVQAPALTGTAEERLRAVASGRVAAQVDVEPVERGEGDGRDVDRGGRGGRVRARMVRRNG